MSSVGYDLDTSGGLMPLIRALIKPPDEEISVQKPKKPQHPYYKRPGKGHNHDSCDACGEGGDLICCDRCPASFHLGCYDPPLDENDIPAGLWLCKECQGSDDNKPASARSSRAQSPVDSKSDTEKKTRILRNNGTSSKKSKDEEEDVKPEVEKELTPMEILVKAAKIMNPTQFELPREMRIPCVFPGTEKECGKNGNGSLVSVDAWGCVPLPAAACFVCRGTCKQAPLLHCDYCPLLFHQDCLDPPLTALPTGRWMCPNHVEQYIDWKLVNSISATERVALWDKFSGPVDQQAVKAEFIRRARRPSPAFRIKVSAQRRGRVLVPAMVRHHYRQPPPLLPSRREYVRCRNVLKNLKSSGAYDSSEEEEEGPKHTICMNTSCGVYSGVGPCGAAPALAAASPRAAAADRDAVLQPQTEQHTTDSSSELSDSDFEYFTASVKKRKVSQSEDKSPGKRGRCERLELRPEGDVERLLAAVDEQLKKLDERLVKLLAWQRLQQRGPRAAGAAGPAARRAALRAAVGAGPRAHRRRRVGPRAPPAPPRLPPLPAAAALPRPLPQRRARARHALRHPPLPQERRGLGAGASDPDAAVVAERGLGQRLRRASGRRRLPPRVATPRRHIHGRGVPALRADKLLGVGQLRERRAVRVRRAGGRRPRAARAQPAAQRPPAGAAQDKRQPDPSAGRRGGLCVRRGARGARGGRGGRGPRRRVGGLGAGAARRAAAVRLPAVRVQHHRRAARRAQPRRTLPIVYRGECFEVIRALAEDLVFFCVVI